MTRGWIAALLVVSIVSAVPLAAQSEKTKPKFPPGYTPGVTTITSFDKEHTVVGWLEIVPFKSEIYHSTRMLRVLVPANYFSPHNARRSYPVLYMQDGQNLFDEVTSRNGEWHMDESVEHLVGGFKIPPMFVVGIDNAGREKRSAEYLPYPDPRNTKDNVADASSVDGKEYARFLITEVMPFIQKRYRIARGPLHTGLGGSSYGATAALYTALEHPGVFGYLLLEAPALWIGNYQLLKDAERAKLLPHKIYLGIGTNENPGDPEFNAQVVKDAEELEGILRKKGMNAAHLKLVVEKGGEHNEASWSRRLPDALLFLYGQ